MAVPKTLKYIEEAKARVMIDKHMKAGTGYWEGPCDYSDFIYKTAAGKYMLIRPGFTSKTWETGVVQF